MQTKNKINFRQYFECLLFNLNIVNTKEIYDKFFFTSSIARQKYHNNLLPLVRVGLNLVCFAPGNDFDGGFGSFDSSAVTFAHF